MSEQEWIALIARLKATIAETDKLIAKAKAQLGE